MLSRRLLLIGAAALTGGFAEADQTVRFLIVGDWGFRGERHQSAVARAMAASAAEIDAQFVISVGDNFYADGVSSVDDPQWRLSFEDVYSDPSLQVPWYVILGNHDYRGAEEAEIAYSALSARWRMPARYWTQTMAVGRARADFFFLDSTPLVAAGADAAPSAEASAQIAWFEAALQRSRADWKIVVAHHPVASGGSHGASAAMERHVRPLLERHRVQLFFNGHDHDLQHLTIGDVNYFCVGSGAETRRVRGVEGTQFAASRAGFAVASLTPRFFSLEFRDEDGAILHTAQIAGG